MAGSRYDRNSARGEALLHFADVPLHELTVTIISFLVDDRSMSTGDRDRRERSREDEAWGIGPNHVDELGGTGDITTDSPVRLTKSA